MAETTILSQYAPRVIDVSASNDGSLTKADISAFSPATIVELKDTALAESEMYRQLTVSRLTGVKELSLYDLLLSRMTNIAPEFQLDGPKGQTYFRPYILRKQEDIVNTNNFNIVAGVEDPAAGTTVAGIAHPSHAWKLMSTPRHSVKVQTRNLHTRKLVSRTSLATSFRSRASSS